LSDSVFLTAGHCTEPPAAHVEIWFDTGPIPLGTFVQDGVVKPYPAPGPDPCAGVVGYPCNGGNAEGTPYTHPLYDPNAFFLFDLGVVELDEPFASPNDIYGQLPQLDELDSLKPSRKTTFTAVGYGLQRSFPNAAAWKNVAFRTRMYAEPHLLQINTGFTGDFSLLLSNNANTGGTCFGDSGGPNFIGESNILAGVTSYGLNRTCAGTGGVYRVDRADDLDWLATFGLP